MSHTIGQAKQNNQQSNFTPSQVDQVSTQPELSTLESMSRLSDADYEFLFNQLLEGIAHGWHDPRIIKFFQQLGDRGKSRDWVTWLDRFRIKILKLPIQSKRQLGTVMIRLGELTHSAPEVNLIGAAAHRIGRELLFGNNQAIVWEYDGLDLVPEASTLNLETEQELSERLPTDFEALSSADVVETKLDSTPELIAQSTATNSSEIAHPALLDSVFESLTDAVASTSDVELVPNELDSELETNISSEPKIEPEKIEIVGNLAESEREKMSPDTSLNISLDLDTEKINDLDPVAIDMQQVMNLIQEDDELAQQISQKLNVSAMSTTDQQIIMEESTTTVADALDESSLELIESWFNLGLKQVSAGELEQAIASWEKALKINPNLSEAWHNRGSALGRLGKYEAAVESFQSALTIDPDNYQAWNDRAHALYQLQNWAEAVSSWSNAIKIMPGNHLFWYNRGCALEQLEKWQDAIASYEKALEIKPDFQLGRSRYINLVADTSHTN